ncbi:putative H(+)/Cl(-) exchange transporter 3 [Apostichopus japonicus]|uniref:Chloride channel protein n=1 Tax=Stichopus japonicus TaxID=307972 RepID=A0A2G8KJW9_STIJA|nr:putative H(+)/Cl(-) exchange transporter 3 [Apostichopus japonicus]
MELDDSPSEGEDEQLLDVSGLGVATWQRGDHRRWGGTNRKESTGAFQDILSVDSTSQYDDFHTIDWVRDVQKYRNQRKEILKKRHDSLRNKIYFYLYSGAGWIVISLVGLATGLCAGIIDIGASWLSDVKLGICANAFWLNQEECCWFQNNTAFGEEGCSEWYTWSEIFRDKSINAGSYIINYICFVLLSVSMASLAVLFVRAFAPYASGSGIPEIKTILSGFIIRGYFGVWTLITKSVTMVLAVAAGLSLGKEGPLVHVACCCGNLFAYLFPKYHLNEAKKREILSAASAAGVSVAFGAPIGGVLFSLEEVSYYFPLKTLWRSFFCALVAASILRWINPFGTDHLVMFYVEYDTPWSFYELIPFAVLGVLGGLYGAMFIKLNLWWCRYRKNSNLKRYPVLEVVILALITAIISYPNPYTRQNSSRLIANLFKECGPEDDTDLCDYQRNFTRVDQSIYPSAAARPGLKNALWQLSFALVVKAALTVFTFGIKVPAGLFIPTIAVGAIAGRIIGVSMEQMAFNHPAWFIFRSCSATGKCITAGLYAMVGAAACLGGVTRMTVSLVVIMFELTGGLVYIVPLMVAVVISKWVGDAFTKGGIYDSHIELNDYPFLDSKRDFIHNTLASDVMRPRRGMPELAVVTQDNMTMEDIEILLAETTFNAFPVIVSKESKRLVGLVYRKELAQALRKSRNKYDAVSQSKVYFTNDVPLYPAPDAPTSINLLYVVDQSPFQVTNQTPASTVVEIFRKLGLRTCLVTQNGTLQGIITKKDVLGHIGALDSIHPDSMLYQ